MGTSQKYKASVAGQPNWGKMTAALMSLAASEAKEEELDQEEQELEVESSSDQEPTLQTTPTAQRKKAIERRRRRLNAQLDNNLRKSVDHAVRAAGGKKAVVSGRSLAFGHSGYAFISNFVNRIVEIAEVGLGRWLEEKAQGRLEDKTPQEVVTTILEFSKESLNTIDSTAASAALESLNDLLRNRLGNDLSKFDEQLQGLLAPGEMIEIIDIFFADYIYNHLSTSVFEKLERKYGQEKALRLMSKIKDQIREDVKAIPAGQQSMSIDWKGQSGKDLIEQEFNRVISIYVPDENNN